MGKTAIAIDLTAIERRELESLASRRKTAQGLAQRARIVLLAAEGEDNKDISVRLGAAPNTVGKWRRRFAQLRMDGVYDEPRPGAPRRIGDDEVAEVIRQTLETTPPGATYWSVRAMAKAAGFAPSRSIGSGKRSILSPIGPKPSNSPPTLCLSRKCAISSGSICRRRSGRWCYASTGTARFRRSIEHSPWLPDAPRPSRAAHARLRASRNAQPVSPLSTRRPALSSGVAIPVIADASS